MLRLTLILHAFIGATLSGVGIIAVLVAGYSAVWPIVMAGVAGFLIAFPVSYLVAKRIS